MSRGRGKIRAGSSTQKIEPLDAVRAQLIMTRGRGKIRAGSNTQKTEPLDAVNIL